MNTERFFEGPGQSQLTTYIWEVALILFVAFVLGYCLRWILNGNLKERVAEVEREKLLLESKILSFEGDKSDNEILTVKINEQKAELDRLNVRLSDTISSKLRIENQLTALQEKYDTLVNSTEPESVQPSASTIQNVPTTELASSKDDLKKIEGIGPKIEQLLNDDAILTYEHLISASVDRIRGILIAAGPNYAVHDPSTWAEQASLANDGKWEALDALQEELKGGKRK